MLKTVKAHYTHGRIEPLEPLILEEGSSVEVTIAVIPPKEQASDPTESTAGAWDGLLDCEQFEDEVYESRLLSTRPDVSTWT